MQERRIIIDADACPRQALQIAQTLANMYGWRCITYASRDHQMSGSDHVTVDPGPDAVDLKIANAVQAGDIVVSQDTGLAALILGKKARVLTPHGRIFDEENIVFQLEVRNEKARFRRGGGRTKGPAARTIEDDRRFEGSLRHLLEREGTSI